MRPRRACAVEPSRAVKPEPPYRRGAVRTSNSVECGPRSAEDLVQRRAPALAAAGGTAVACVQLQPHSWVVGVSPVDARSTGQLRNATLTRRSRARAAAVVALGKAGFSWPQPIGSRRSRATPRQDERLDHRLGRALGDSFGGLAVALSVDMALDPYPDARDGVEFRGETVEDLGGVADEPTAAIERYALRNLDLAVVVQ